MAKSRFKITPFTNPSGARVYRVSGTLDGNTIRKNFKSRSEAVAHRQELDIKYLNGESEGQTVWTTLTQEQNRDAIAAVSRLRRNSSTKTLGFAVDYFLEHYRESAESKTVEEATTEYIALKETEQERTIISFPQVRAIRFQLAKFGKNFSNRIVGEIQPQELLNYLELPARDSDKPPSLKTSNNRKGYLSTFFKYCLAKGYVGVNPILELPNYKIKKSRGTATTLSAGRAKKLMSWLESYRGEKNKDGQWWGKPGCMVPYFALTLFAGIRPDWENGEIRKLRAKDIRLDTGVIFIEPDVSKVNEKRSIEIQPNLRRWLESYPLNIYPVFPKRFKYMRTTARRKFKLSNDVLRHTYISMLVGKFRSVGDAALQAGNSEAIIRKHYLNLKTTEEAKRFWNIKPKTTPPLNSTD